jgi:hypothetical protein
MSWLKPCPTRQRQILPLRQDRANRPLQTQQQQQRRKPRQRQRLPDRCWSHRAARTEGEAETHRGGNAARFLRASVNRRLQAPEEASADEAEMCGGRWRKRRRDSVRGNTRSQDWLRHERGFRGHGLRGTSARMRRSPSREGDEGAEAKGWRRLAGVVQRDRAGPRGRDDFRFFGTRWLPGAVQGSETRDEGSN